jgi:hypothetical protein
MSERVLTPRRTRVSVHELTERGLVVDVDGAELATDVWPDEHSARRAARLATRLVDVELEVGADATDPSGWQARVTAVWHRVPTTRPVSVSTALAFLLSGVPTYVVGATPAPGGVAR